MKNCYGLLITTLLMTSCAGDRFPAIPDFTQTDRDAHLPGNGATMCGPVSVANSLLWLSENGFPRLAPPGDNRHARQAAMIRTLCSADYMNTSLKTGTGASNLLDGVARYIRDAGYEFRRLEYQGRRTVAKPYATSVSAPSPDWIRQGLEGLSGVWLNVGWYTYDPSREVYHRIGGHWVTVVGQGKDEKGRTAANVLILHDPAPRTGLEPAEEYATLEPLSGGRLESEKKTWTRSAKGYFKLTGGMHMKKGADVAILEGAVVLQMP